MSQQLSSLGAEKRGLEDLCRRMDSQLAALRDEKASVLSTAEAAEERAVELGSQKETLAEERARALEQLAVVQAEKRGVEELSKRECQQLHDELQAAQLRGEAVDDRCKEVGRARDALQEEKSHMSEQLAVLQAERRRSEDLARRSDQSLVSAMDDKAAAVSRADAADERAREAIKTKEGALLERAKLEEELAVAQTERKRADEIGRLNELKLRDELGAVQAHCAGGWSRSALAWYLRCFKDVHPY